MHDSILSVLVATLEDQTWSRHRGMSCEDLRCAMAEETGLVELHGALYTLNRWRYIRLFIKNNQKWVKITELGAETHFAKSLSDNGL